MKRRPQSTQPGLISVVSAVLLFLACASGQAQTTITGAVQGEVQEAGSRLPLSGARIIVINQDTQVPRATLTDEQGRYYMATLLPGKYTVTCEMDGYAPISEPNITIQVSRPEVLGIPPFLMIPEKQLPLLIAAPVGEDVRMVNLTNATRSGNFDERTTQALPLGAIRSFDELALLLPGVAPPPQNFGSTTGPGAGKGIGTAGQFAVNGLWSRANNFTIDGSDNNDEDVGVRRQGYLSLVPQPIETIKDFHISTLLPESQYGRNMGAQVNVVSASGGRRFNGALYGFLTDSSLNARNFFDFQPGGTHTVTARGGRSVLLDGSPMQVGGVTAGENPFTRGQYGFVVGGPLSQKTFFTFSYEHQDINASRTAHFAVPSVDDRGLFGRGATGLAVGPNNLPTRPSTETGDAFFSLYPFPNNLQGPYGANTFTEVLPAGGDGDVASFRVDRDFRAFGAEHYIHGRYNFTDDRRILPVTGEAMYSSLEPATRTQNIALALSSVISYNVFNEARVSYGRTALGFGPARNPRLLDTTRPITDALGLRDKPFLLNMPLVRNNTLPGGPPTFATDPDLTVEQAAGGTIGALGQVVASGFSPLGVDVFTFPQERANNTFQYADTLRIDSGIHQFTLGVDLRRNQLNSFLNRNARPLAVFQAARDLGSDTGELFSRTYGGVPGVYLGSDLLAAGAATTFSQRHLAQSDAMIGLRFWQTNFFFQDRIHPTRNLTLTFGVRYEFNTVPTDVNGRLESAIASDKVGAFEAQERERYGSSGLQSFLGGRTKMYEADKNNLGPYLSMAWDPFGDGMTSIRAGYGVYYNLVPGVVISQARTIYGDAILINCPGIRGGPTLLFTNPTGLAAGGSLNLATANRLTTPEAFLGTISSQGSSYGSAGTSFTFPDKALESPYAHHFSLSIERQLGSNVLLSAAYVGTRGVHLLRLNTPNYGTNSIPRITGLDSSGGVLQLAGRQVAPSPVVQGAPTGFRPHPMLGSFLSINSDGRSSYDSLQLALNKRYSSGFQFTTSYTWSHAFDHNSDIFDLLGSTALPQNIFDLDAERASASFDLRHRFVLSAVWEMPMWRDNPVLGGWQLSTISTMQTGQPYTLYSGIDANFDGNISDRLRTVNGITEVDDGAVRLGLPSDQATLLPAAGTNGAVGRNAFRAPGIANVDIALVKNFNLGESHRIQLRAEAYNIFNRTHFGFPVNQLFFAGAGRSVDTLVGARTIQFALKYQFGGSQAVIPGPGRVAAPAPQPARQVTAAPAARLIPREPAEPGTDATRAVAAAPAPPAEPVSAPQQDANLPPGPASADAQTPQAAESELSAAAEPPPQAATTTTPARGEGRVIILESARPPAPAPAPQPERSPSPPQTEQLSPQATLPAPRREPPPAPTVPASGGIVVQVGAFSSAEGASRLTNELRQKGHAAITITGSDYHRVVVGPFPSEADATNVQSELQQQGYAGYVRPNPATE